MFSVDSNDLSDGCERETYLHCGKQSNKFLPIENMRLATDPTTTLIWTSSPVATCDSACIANCSCNAYAYDGNKCLMWTRDAFNLKQLDANMGQTFFLRVASLNTSTATANNGKYFQYLLTQVASRYIFLSFIFVLRKNQGS